MTVHAMEHVADPAGGGRVDPALALAIADELVALTAQLSELAYDLGSSPETLRRHMGSLQAVDAITQGQLAIAELLRSDAPIADRIAAVTLESLAASLDERYRQRSLAGGTADAADAAA